MEKPKLIEAGKIVNTHGVRGEVKLQSWMDSPEVLAGFRTLYLDGKPVRVESAYVHKGSVIARLAGVSDMNTAMALKNRTVCIHRDDAALPEGGFFYADILGARVVTEDGAEVGVLADVLEYPAQNVYVVRGERERLIPAVPAFVLRTDVDSGVITVRLIDGM